MTVNIVELIVQPDDCAFDQPCKFGHRVEGHAVYCHNDSWTDSPRKCRRTWYTGGETKDEDCPGYQPNPAHIGAQATPLFGRACTKCGGSKLIQADRGTTETCPLCMGSGEAPLAVKLTQHQQDALELGIVHSGRHPGQHDRYVCIAETNVQRRGIDQLWKAGLVDVRSVSFTGKASVYLLRLTCKGDAVLRANWESALTAANA